MSETMDLILVDAQNAVEIFTKGGMRAILDGIEAKVRAIPLDPSTATGREEIRSVAYRVARTKVALDAEGKKLTEGWREATKRVNEERRLATERLDALGEEVRKPVTDFENKERLRVEAHEAALKDITGLNAMIAAYPYMTVSLLEEHLGDLEKSNVGRDWEEFTQRAKSARDDAHAYITKRIGERKKFDADQAELERLRKEEAERFQRERDEKLKAEAAEKARLEAERKAKEQAERVKAESERQAREAEAARVREENAKLAAEQRARDAEAARIAAERKAEADKKVAEEQAAADLKAAREKAKRDAEAAAQREREKMERERKAAEDARLKREADQKHKDRIRSEILSDCMAIDPEFSSAVLDALMEGKIRNVRVIF